MSHELTHELTKAQRALIRDALSVLLTQVHMPDTQREIASLLSLVARHETVVLKRSFFSRLIQNRKGHDCDVPLNHLRTKEY